VRRKKGGVTVKLHEWNWDNISAAVSELNDRQCRDKLESILDALTQLHRRLTIHTNQHVSPEEKATNCIHALLTFGAHLSDIFEHYDEFYVLSGEVWKAYYDALDAYRYPWSRQRSAEYASAKE
jgi:hypothetical protein